MQKFYQELYKKDPKDFTRKDAKILVETPETPGEGRGEHLLTGMKYIKEKEGEEGLKKYLEEMKNLGYPIDSEKMDPMGWYPVGLRALSFVVLKKIFNWDDKKFIEMGHTSAAVSFIVKFFFEHFLSRKIAFENAYRYWGKQYTVGELKSIEFSYKKKYGILQLHDFKFHPLYCLFFVGYFLRICELGGERGLIVEETKCMFKGDPYHEFLVRWK